jgi:hypothetical protein
MAAFGQTGGELTAGQLGSAGNLPTVALNNEKKSHPG